MECKTARMRTQVDVRRAHFPAPLTIIVNVRKHVVVKLVSVGLGKR